jgi:hypothetical protein
MSRTKTTFGLLQAAALTLGLAIILWSLGLSSFRFAEAANVTSFSDTLSDSAPVVGSDHTITFTTPTGIVNGQTIVVDFSDGPFVVGSVDFTDIDVIDGSTNLSVAADCSGLDETSAAFSGTTLTITFCSGDSASIAPNGTTTILIGENATFGVAGNAQLGNPTVGSYEIDITAGAADSGSTRVAIIAPVVVTAAVDTSFTFTVTGVGGGGSATVNQEPITGTSTATTIPFGTLTANTASTAAQELSVETNASYGYAVTVQVDQQLTSSTGADIDGFANGAFTSTPIAWAQPSESISNEDTWGHWGLTSDDATFGLADPFDAGGTGQLFVSASTTPVEVMRHNGPSDGTTQNIGLARVGYTVEISPLQEAGNDYTATLTYVATPVF